MSDKDGFVAVSTRHLPDVTVVPPWAAASMSLGNQTLQDGILWVHGWMAVDGIVTTRGDRAGFAPERADLHVLINSKGAPQMLPSVSALQRLLDRSCTPGQPSESGTFDVVAPRVHGLTFAASLNGWRSASQTVDVSRGAERDHVELYLDRAPRVRGIARSSDGLPLGNLSVWSICLVKITADEATPDQMRLLKPEGGITYSVDTVTGRARAKFMTCALTDRDGRFELSLPIPGEVLVVAFPFGHRPIYHELGTPGADDCDVEIVGERIHESSMVRVVANGKPFSGEKLFVADLSLKDGDAQPGVYVKLSADSRAPTDWLTSGRRLFFQIKEFSGHLVWDGRETLDVARDLRPVTELPR